MPDDVVQRPDSDPIHALTGYRNYLKALSAFIRVTYPGRGQQFRAIVEAQKQLPGFDRVRQQSTYSRARVRELLFNAWHTEIALGLPDQFDDPGLVRFTNQWAPVQAYYAIYSLWRAWFVVNQLGIESHRQSLKSVSALLRQRRVLPSPWDHATAGGFLLRDAEHLGFASERVHDVSQLSTPEWRVASEDWISKILRTSRKFFLEELESKWKRENRTRAGRPYRAIPSSQRDRIRATLHPTTLFDFLYRLRVRSNYMDVDDFVSGQLSNADAERYFKGLLHFCRSTMLVVECVLRQAMGSDAFDSAAERFIESDERARHSGLPIRMRVVRG